MDMERLIVPCEVNDQESLLIRIIPVLNQDKKDTRNGFEQVSTEMPFFASL